MAHNFDVLIATNFNRDCKSATAKKVGPLYIKC